MAEFALTMIQFQSIGGLKLKLVTVDQQIDLFAGAYALQRYENGFKPNSIRPTKASSSAYIDSVTLMALT